MGINEDEGACRGVSVGVHVCIYNYCMVWSTSSWAGCYCRRVLLFLPFVSVLQVNFQLLWSLKPEQCSIKCHLCDSSCVTLCCI